MITDEQTGTRIDEIEENIYRISVPVPPNPALPPGFTFNQFLIVDDDPVLFHSGLRKIFPLVRQAIERVIPVSDLRYIGISHFESDEAGALNEFLAVAPNAQPLCSAVGKMVSVDDFANREARALADGEQLSIGSRTLRWLDTPHLPHGWDCGYLFDEATRTLLCGDLFTQPGQHHDPVTESDILGPSEVMRRALGDYFVMSENTGALIDKVAATEPQLLACMHGASYRGNGAALLQEMKAALMSSDSSR
jgi:flavorubredoxin